MAFERLGPIVERVVGRIANEVGEGAIEPAPDAVNLAKSRKRTRTEARAKFREVKQRKKTAVEATQPGTTPASLGNAKGRRTHPHELAPLGVRQPLMLVWVNPAHVRRPHRSTPDLRVARCR